MLTTTTSLVDRYIAEVVKRVPEPTREDVAATVRTEADAAIGRARQEGLDPQAAQVQALTELGDPGLLAAKHGGHAQHLIGPAYFGQWWRLLRLLLVTVLPTVGAIMLILQGLTGNSVETTVTSTLNVVFQVGVQLVLWVTVAFAIMDRYAAEPAHPDWTPDDLPEPVEGSIGLGDMVLSITLLAALIWAILWQRDHWLVTVGGSEVPALNPDAWSFWFPLLLAVLCASLFLEVVKYAVGHWTVALAVVNTALNALFAGVVLWLWTSETLINPAVVATLPEGIPGLLGALPWVIVLVCLWDTFDGWWRAVRR
jgi:hypothetical protein